MVYHNHYRKENLKTVVLVNSGPTVLGSITWNNAIAAVRYIQLFDAASTDDVTIGTTAPQHEIRLPSSTTGGGSTDILEGVRYQNGVVAACTTAHEGGTASGDGVDVYISHAGAG